MIDSTCSINNTSNDDTNNNNVARQTKYEGVCSAANTGFSPQRRDEKTRFSEIYFFGFYSIYDVLLMTVFCKVLLNLINLKYANINDIGLSKLKARVN